MEIGSRKKTCQIGRRQGPLCRLIDALVRAGMGGRVVAGAHVVEGEQPPQSAERPAEQQEGQGPMKKYNDRQCRGAGTLRLYRDTTAVWRDCKRIV